MIRSVKSNEQTAADMAVQAKQHGQDMALLRNQVVRMRCITLALWNLVKSHLNLDEQELMRMADEIEAAERQAVKVAEKCPQCDRTLQDSSNFCIYCGAKVVRRSLV